MDYLDSFALYTLTFSVGLFSYSYYRFMAYKMIQQNRIEKKIDKYVKITGKVLEKVVDNQKKELLQSISDNKSNNNKLRLLITRPTSPTMVSSKTINSNIRINLNNSEKIRNNKSKSFDFSIIDRKNNKLSSMVLSDNVLYKRLKKIE